MTPHRLAVAVRRLVGILEAAGAPTGLKVNLDVRDYHSGETYFTVQANLDGEVVGEMPGGEYDDVISVHNIVVAPEHRRKGIARAMIQKALDEFPNAKMELGMSVSPEGESLRKIIPPARLAEAVSDESDAVADDFQGEFLERHPHLAPLFRTIVKGTVVGHARGTEVASFERGRIVLKPEFFDTLARDGIPATDWIYAHELGHALESNLGLTDWTRKATELGIDVWDVSSLPHGQVKMDEAFAETFAVLAMRDADGVRMLDRRWPAWADLVEWAAESVGVELTVGAGR